MYIRFSVVVSVLCGAFTNAVDGTDKQHTDAVVIQYSDRKQTFRCYAGC